MSIRVIQGDSKGLFIKYKGKEYEPAYKYTFCRKGDAMRVCDDGSNDKGYVDVQTVATKEQVFVRWPERKMERHSDVKKKITIEVDVKVYDYLVALAEIDAVTVEEEVIALITETMIEEDGTTT